jgi:6-phosphogluconolactonase
MALQGEVRIVADPPAAYAALVAEALADWSEREPGHRELTAKPFGLAVSGGGSGEACMRALIAGKLDWSKIALYFVDERCVPEDAPQSNAGSLRKVLGPHLEQLASWSPMSCEDGPEHYQRLIESLGRLDLVQLGFGPDGHTASLFPGSPGLEAPSGALVVTNRDLTGRNPLDRMTLTFEAIATAPTVVVVVSGAEKREALGRLLDGEDLPAGRVRAERLIWLIDEAATSGLRDRLAGT